MNARLVLIGAGVLTGTVQQSIAKRRRNASAPSTTTSPPGRT